MKNCSIMTIFKRELAAYFNAAIAYIFIIVFVLLSASLYMTQFFVIGLADMRPFFGVLPFILAVFMPAVSMRLWAEEKRGNTLELLLTFPVHTHEIVIGKFLASLVFYLAALAATLPIPIMLHVLGNPDPGTILGGYIGALLLGAFYLAVGIFISGFCRDQIVAFIVAMIVCFGLYLFGLEFMASSIDGWLPGFGTLLRLFLGSAAHYETFIKGVIDNRDLLYFVVGSIIFLTLNGFWLEGRMKTGAKKIFIAATLISVGIFFTSNWLLADFSLGRFDFTEGRIYTTSEATKKIFASLKAPVTAKFYVSPQDKMPTGMKTIEADVVAKLDELRVASKGNFQYKIFHMEAANVVEPQEEGKEETLEQQLEKKGIQPFQVRAIESDEVAVRLIYSAISVAYKEKPEEIVPRIMPDNMNELEYMLASRIYRMTLPEKPRIALMAPYEEKQVDPMVASLLAQMGGNVPSGYRDDNYELIEAALRYEGFDTSRIRLTKEEGIPSGTKTLIVMEPSGLNDRQRYEINRFLRGGGSVFLAVQNYLYNYQALGQSLSVTPDPRNPEINSLLSSWGFEVDDQILVDAQHDVISIGSGSMGPFETSVPVKVPIQILINQDGMNPNLSITSRLSQIFYLWGTAIKKNDEKIKSEGLKVETLLNSSGESWTVPAPKDALLPQNLARQPESRIGPFPLAVLAQGQFSDAYDGKDIPDWPKEPGKSPENAQKDGIEDIPAPVTPAPGKLILIGASTPFQKNILRGGGHLNFFLNSVDALTLGDDLVTIRSKQPIDRSIARVSATTKIFWRFLIMLIVPVVIAAAGFSRVLLRRQAKQNYLKNYMLAS